MATSPQSFTAKGSGPAFCLDISPLVFRARGIEALQRVYRPCASPMVIASIEQLTTACIKKFLTSIHFCPHFFDCTSLGSAGEDALRSYSMFDPKTARDVHTDARNNFGL